MSERAWAQPVFERSNFFFFFNTYYLFWLRAWVDERCTNNSPIYVDV